MFQRVRLFRLSIARYRGALPCAANAARALSFLSVVALAGCEGLPRVEVKPASGLITTEGGGTVKLIVSLADRPATPVEVRAVSSDPSEGRVSAPVVLDAQNFDAQQALYVTGVDDAERDGDVPYEVDIYARSTTRPGDPGWLVTRLKLTNRDDDVPRFEALGHLPGGAAESFAAATSADGSVVVGFSGTGAPDQAFRWSTQGMVGLGGASSRAAAVSPDGTKIVGSVADTRFEKGRAAASFAPGQPSQLLAEPPQPGPAGGLLLYFVDGTVVLDDGTVFGTCIQYGAYGEPIGCRKSGSALGLASGSYLYAADSVHYAGTQNAERHAPFSSRALFDGKLLDYPGQVTCNPNTGCEAAIRAYSTGGQVLVGTSRLPINGLPLRDFAIRYELIEGTVTMRDLDGGELASGAYAISADGRLTGGWGSDERGQQATLWIDREPHALEDYLLDQGGTLPDGWTLREIRALSRDGRVLVGNGINAEGHAEAFRVTLPSEP